MTDLKNALHAAHEAKASNEEHERIIQQKDFREEHEPIYDAFLRALKSNTLDPRGKEFATFLHDNIDNLFKDVNLKKIKPLSEENFCRFLLATLKKIKVENLASKENLTNKKIQKLVNGCISDVRDTQRNDLLIQGFGWLVGIKIDSKKITTSFKKGMLSKIPFLGSKEEHELPKSDTELVSNVLVKVFLPIFVIAITAVFIKVSQIMIIFGVIGLTISTGKAISSLFANTIHDLRYAPEVQSKDWEGSIINDINEILLKDLEQQPPDQKRSPLHVGAEEERRKNNSPGCLRTYS
ncbi:Hypothetical protein CINCED_3A008881 [Cinara cedri]|uniref:Uncharacterized protein n=1 Tax=Cinara cedri TaxID=506608 RepID=A0A5E4NHX0_9HEMI|nr:Hypothetical protein CINCED_3A008881 [Cinara cedri]